MSKKVYLFALNEGRILRVTFGDKLVCYLMNNDNKSTKLSFKKAYELLEHRDTLIIQTKVSNDGGYRYTELDQKTAIDDLQKDFLFRQASLKTHAQMKRDGQSVPKGQPLTQDHMRKNLSFDNLDLSKAIVNKQREKEQEIIDAFNNEADNENGDLNEDEFIEEYIKTKLEKEKVSILDLLEDLEKNYDMEKNKE